MKYLFSALLLALSLAPLAAQADVASVPTGEHEDLNCIRVENAAAYPDYIFFADSLLNSSVSVPRPLGGVQTEVGPFAAEIVSETPGCFQDPAAWGGPRYIVAMKASDTSASEIAAQSKLQFAEQSPLGNGQNVSVYWSQVVLPYADVQESNALQSTILMRTVHIDSVDATGMTAHLTTTESLDNKGNVLKTVGTPTPAEPVTPPSVPANYQPVAASPLPPAQSTMLLWLVVISLGAVILALVIKTWKR